MILKYLDLIFNKINIIINIIINILNIYIYIKWIKIYLFRWLKIKLSLTIISLYYKNYLLF